MWNLNPISGDDLGAPNVISATGTICAGDSDWFEIFINEDLAESHDILGAVRLQTSPGDALRITVNVVAAEGDVVVTPHNSTGNSAVTANGMAQIDLALVDDLAVDQWMRLQIKVDGATPASDNHYTLTVYGAGSGGT
jgi:hypothetical protein